jgi:hypothetical protein
VKRAAKAPNHKNKIHNLFQLSNQKYLLFFIQLCNLDLDGLKLLITLSFGGNPVATSLIKVSS